MQSELSNARHGQSVQDPYRRIDDPKWWPSPNIPTSLGKIWCKWQDYLDYVCNERRNGNIIKQAENPIPAASNDGYFQIIMLTNIAGHLKIDEEKFESSKGNLCDYYKRKIKFI